MHFFSRITALGAAALVGTTSAQPASLGCYGDDQYDRVLEAMHTSSRMTPSVCANYCRSESPSYVYYATQRGKECWCQDSSIDLRHGARQCDFDCSGDSSIKCGGYDSFTLYDLENTDVPPLPTGSNYVGCYADDQNDRVLDDAMTTSSGMTSEICAAFCASESPSNKYYATQWGVECWCAAEVDLSNGGATCNFACGGDADTTCGGFDAFDLFELDGAVIDPVTPTDPLAPTPTEGYYLGCFADDQGDRVLEGKTTSGDMTLEVCEAICVASGQPFFALQYGVECWCGGCELLVAGQDRYDRHGTASCFSYPCSGDASRQCGGFDAFSLYYRGSCGVTPAPTSPAPTTPAPGTPVPTTPSPFIASPPRPVTPAPTTPAPTTLASIPTSAPTPAPTLAPVTPAPTPAPSIRHADACLIFHCLPGNVYLDLSNCGLTDDNFDDIRECFANVGLASILSIYLGDSELTSLKGSIDSGVGSLFDGLVALQELGLDDNEIRVLEAGAFADLGALQYLGLSSNPIHRVEDGAFDGLENLQSLYLYGVDVPALPRDVFNDLPVSVRMY